MLACLKHTLDNLPIGLGRRQARLNPSKRLIVHAHHYDASNGKWNAQDRFASMPHLEEAKDRCSVWEVGAFERADDSRVLMGAYPNCKFHAYEPIPRFFEKLDKLWSGESRIVPHNYGLGGKDSYFLVDEASLKGQGTYIGDNANKQGSVRANIKTFDFAVSEAGGQFPSLLHLNCEGCEWTLLPEAIESGFIENVPMIQIGWHNYGEVDCNEEMA